MPLPPGTIVAGKYTIQSELGQAPVSTTYAAIAAPGREFVLRMMTPESFDDAKATAIRALHLAAATVPDHLVAHVVEEKRDEGTKMAFIATERSKHPSLAEMVAVCPFEPKDALAVISGAVRACAALHAEGIAHLSIHPRNVFVGPEPERVVQLVDLCAHRLRPAAAPWAAPEQLEGGETSPATDIYAMALLSYYALTGKPLFDTKTPVSVQAKAYGITLPAAVDDVFAKALARTPSERWTTLDDFLAALAEALGLAKPQPSLPDSLKMPLARISLRGSFPEADPSDSGKNDPIPMSLPPPPPAPALAPAVKAEREAREAREAAVARGELPISEIPWKIIGAAGSSVVVLIITVIVLVKIGSKPIEPPSPPAPASAATRDPIVVPPPPPPPPPEPEPETSASAEPAPPPRPVTSSDDDAPTLDLKPHEGELVVECEPACELVMIDRRRSSVYPAHIPLHAGLHGVGVSRRGYVGQWQAVTIVAGKKSVLRYTLVPKMR